MVRGAPLGASRRVCGCSRWTRSDMKERRRVLTSVARQPFSHHWKSARRDRDHARGRRHPTTATADDRAALVTLRNSAPQVACGRRRSPSRFSLVRDRATRAMIILHPVALELSRGGTRQVQQLRQHLHRRWGVSGHVFDRVAIQCRGDDLIVRARVPPTAHNQNSSSSNQTNRAEEPATCMRVTAWSRCIAPSRDPVSYSGIVCALCTVCGRHAT